MAVFYMHQNSGEGVTICAKEVNIYDRTCERSSKRMYLNLTTAIRVGCTEKHIEWRLPA